MCSTLTRQTASRHLETVGIDGMEDTCAFDTKRIQHPGGVLPRHPRGWLEQEAFLDVHAKGDVTDSTRGNGNYPPRSRFEVEEQRVFRVTMLSARETCGSPRRTPGAQNACLR